MRRIAILSLCACALGCHQNIRPRWEVSFQVGTTSKINEANTITTSLVVKLPNAAAQKTSGDFGKIGVEVH